MIHHRFDKSVALSCAHEINSTVEGKRMFKQLTCGVAALIGALVFSVGTADARWEQLGCRKVGFLVDRDVVPVGRLEGRFKSVRLSVAGNAIFLRDVKVVYANGNVDDYPVRTLVPAGTQTRAIDLKGERRAIKQIELTYRSRASFKGRATVCVLGNT